MESIINWVRNLIFIILFTTLLEMFLPDSSMRKYVRLVMGFFIIMIFITPLAAVFNRNITTVYQVRPETNIFSGDWEEIKRRGEEIGQSNEQLLAGYYRERIAERVRAVIALDYGDYEQEIAVELDNNYHLERINISLIDRQVREVKIDRIEIGSEQLQFTEDTEEEKSVDEALMIINLKNRLSELFQLPLSNIDISIIRNRGDYSGITG